MQLLKDRIISEGRVTGEDILKVDSFLNHQIDVQLFNDMAKEFSSYFNGRGITRILTIEASGIALACITAQYFNVPVVFAKKTESKNLDSDLYQSEVFSYTKGKPYRIMVSKRYINADDRVLLIDDFLANGKALAGLLDIVEQAGAVSVGAGIAIEKGFQDGGRLLREKGLDIKSLSTVMSLRGGRIELL